MLLTVCCVASALLVTLTGRNVHGSPTATCERASRQPDNEGSVLFNENPSTASTDIQKRHLVVVSTMDGNVAALDALTGDDRWSLSTGNGPLLSSSISKLEIFDDTGKAKHLIPSLDGHLYQFNGENVEPVPLAADLLISSSFHFTDDSATGIVGGKEIETYGIDLASGKVRYSCTLSGCKYFDGQPNYYKAGSVTDDVLVIKRSTKTVRAVELVTGVEQWNFSVGQHELSYISHLRPSGHDQMGRQDETLRVTDDSDPSLKDSDNKNKASSSQTSQTCSLPVQPVQPQSDDDQCDQCDVQTEDDFDEENIRESPTWSSDPPPIDGRDIEVRISVPGGHVVAFDHNNPNVILWQRKFRSSIAAAWTLRDRQLSEISLFDGSRIQNSDNSMFGSTCTDGQTESDFDESLTNYMGPLLYIGTFDGQMYVQPLVNTVPDMTIADAASGAVDMPRIRWRPYIATAPSRTPAASVPRYRLRIGSDKDTEANAVIQWHDQYPFDGGYFLFPDYVPVQKVELLTSNQTLPPPASTDITVSLFNWWKLRLLMMTIADLAKPTSTVKKQFLYRKEVLGISILMSVVINLLLIKCYKLRHHRPHQSCAASQIMATESSKKNDNSVADEQTTAVSVAVVETPNHPEYVSRYLTDFTQELCLGRGGFGVVFRARNQLDDCVYAIKRIALHDSQRAREKVTREVKALAKLEHPGIVRYYQSWFECPPPGWQEEKDRLLCDCTMSSPSVGLSPMTSSVGRTDGYRRPAADKHRASKIPDDSSLLKPFDISAELLQLSPGDDDDTNCSSLTSEPGDVLFNQQIGLDSSLESVDGSLSSRNDETPSAKLDDSGTETDSFDISFRDDSQSSSSKTAGQRSSGIGGSSSRHPSRSVESSLDIVFEHSHEHIDAATGGGQNTNSAACDVSLEDDEEMQDSSRSRHVRRPRSLQVNSAGSLALSEGVGSPSSLQRKLYLYIQMQLCQTESLKGWLNNNTLNRDKRQLLDIFHQITSAINYVHSSGLMHRDLKPSNIFFAMDGSIKIGDFGLATAVEENCCDIETGDGVSMAGGDRLHTDKVGTKLYMSPEQCSGRNYTHKVDIYALGMIFFELFYPFATEMERVKTLLDVRSLNFPSRFQRELADEAVFVRQLLVHDPESRPSAKSILQHPIIVDFEEASQAYWRLHSQSRNRTMSNCSSNSSGDGPPPLPSTLPQ